MATNQMSNLHKFFMLGGQTILKMFCQDIRNKTAIKANFNFSSFKSTETLKLP